MTAFTIDRKLRAMRSYDLLDNPIRKMTAWIKCIPNIYKIAILSSFVIGIFAHLYCYTNALLIHDAIEIYRAPVDGTSGGRWLLSAINSPLGLIQMPWAIGAVTLLLYGIACGVVARTLGITKPVLVVLLSGVMVTSHTAITANCYLSSAHIYAFALLTSCLAVYAFHFFKFGWLWSFLFLMLSLGAYPAYIGMTVCLFLGVAIKDIFCSDKKTLSIFMREVTAAVLVVVACLCCYGIIFSNAAPDGGLQEGSQVAIAASMGLKEIAFSVIQAYRQVFVNFLVYGAASYLRGPVFLFFWIGIVACAIVIMRILQLKKMRHDVPRLIVLLLNFTLLPLAMNAIRILSGAVHSLMTFSFIFPWILLLFVYEAYESLTKQETAKQLSNKRICNFYGWIVFLTCVLTIFTGWKTANETYMKEFVLYESGFSLATRIVDRIESVDGYDRDTKIILVGDTEKYYAPYREAFISSESFAGVSANTAFTYPATLKTFIQKQLGISMLLNSFTQEEFEHALRSAEFAEYSNMDVDQILKNIAAYPKKDCYKWLNEDTLLFYLG